MPSYLTASAESATVSQAARIAATGSEGYAERGPLRQLSTKRQLPAGSPTLSPSFSDKQGRPSHTPF